MVLKFGQVFEEINISIVNSMGQKIYNTTFNFSDAVTFGIGNASKGLYFVTVNTNTAETATLKFIKN
ncbi:hypothetical protein CSW08_07685 [Confluentibacter flavum]|uniref:Secretion system C-terminal sorting domain-containing protein n=2 Tax=Confluentibacter flavum TaxID=1909700 RepID=A0A2N3HKM7_9FLAO|nr:hypothetical protein CSW08_07685 [Confluentibacter flavum]